MPANKRKHTTNRETSAGTSPEVMAEDSASPLGSKVATVAVVGLAAALIEVELVPGILLGVAAMLAPDIIPKLGKIMRPLVKGTVRASYAVAEKSREMMAEAGEHIEDIVAEVRSEQGLNGAAAK